MMDAGRKFWVTVLGMAMVFLLALLAKLTDGASGTLGAMVLAFCGGNAAVSVAYARHASSSESTSRVIEDRRDAVRGIEPTP